jgi:hypothetical protein
MAITLINLIPHAISKYWHHSLRSENEKLLIHEPSLGSSIVFNSIFFEISSQRRQIRSSESAYSPGDVLTPRLASYSSILEFLKNSDSALFTGVWDTSRKKLTKYKRNTHTIHRRKLEERYRGWLRAQEELSEALETTLRSKIGSGDFSSSLPAPRDADFIEMEFHEVPFLK